MPATGEPRRWTSDPPGEPALKPAVSQSSRVDVSTGTGVCMALRVITDRREAITRFWR